VTPVQTIPITPNSTDNLSRKRSFEPTNDNYPQAKKPKYENGREDEAEKTFTGFANLTFSSYNNETIKSTCVNTALRAIKTPKSPQKCLFAFEALNFQFNHNTDPALPEEQDLSVAATPTRLQSSQPLDPTLIVRSLIKAKKERGSIDIYEECNDEKLFLFNACLDTRGCQSILGLMSKSDVIIF
jgi:hypothetical protein